MPSKLTVYLFVTLLSISNIYAQDSSHGARLAATTKVAEVYIASEFSACPMPNPGTVREAEKLALGAILLSHVLGLDSETTPEKDIKRLAAMAEVENSDISDADVQNSHLWPSVSEFRCASKQIAMSEYLKKIIPLAGQVRPTVAPIKEVPFTDIVAPVPPAPSQPANYDFHVSRPNKTYFGDSTNAIELENQGSKISTLEKEQRDLELQINRISEPPSPTISFRPLPVQPYSLGREVVPLSPKMQPLGKAPGKNILGD